MSCIRGRKALWKDFRRKILLDKEGDVLYTSVDEKGCAVLLGVDRMGVRLNELTVEIIQRCPNACLFCSSLARTDASHVLSAQNVSGGRTRDLSRAYSRWRIVLDELVELPEGARVRCVLMPETQNVLQQRAESPRHAGLLKFAGIVKDTPPDAARNLDAYLHGRKKP